MLFQDLNLNQDFKMTNLNCLNNFKFFNISSFFSILKLNYIAICTLSKVLCEPRSRYRDDARCVGPHRLAPADLERRTERSRVRTNVFFWLSNPRAWGPRSFCARTRSLPVLRAHVLLERDATWKDG